MDGIGFLGRRVVQVHLTRRCNLSCLHCYSESGPHANGEIPLVELVERLSALRSEGYDVVSLSGGEPLMYRPLQDLLKASRRLGYRTNMVTNGTLLNVDRLALLREYASVVAVSLDGLEARHDKIRGRSGAFSRALRGCDALAEADIRFGIAHCFTRGSIPEIPELCAMAAESGASLFQLHPIAAIGRGVGFAPASELTATDLARVFVIAKLLSVQHEAQLAVQVDVASAEKITTERCQYSVLDADATTRAMSDLVNPLVLDERGALWPLAYGMAGSQRIASPDEGWWNEVLQYKRGRGQPLRRLLEAAIVALDGGMVDWYAHVTRTSHLLEASPQRARSAAG